MRVSADSLIGKTIGKLHIKSVYRKERRTYSICDCSCGTKSFHTRVDGIRSGATASCGCLKKENNGKRTHGMYQTRVYKIWGGMIGRTSNPANQGYDGYGGSGISVSSEWREFENFYRDMGDPPTDKHSLDRIDGTKGYSKVNCRWANNSIQAKNQKKRNRGDTVSNFKGVHFDSRGRGCWSGGVTKDYTTVRVGSGKDEVLAAKYFNFMTKYLYETIVELNPVCYKSLTIEQAVLLHSRLEAKFHYDSKSKDYKPTKGE